MSKFDTNEPILIVIRRGRGGRGFLVSPIENISNAAPCADAVEVGESILEMLNDTSQPRVNMNDLLSSASSSKSVESTNRARDDDDDDEDDEDEDEDDGEDDGPLSGDGDLADKMIMFGLSSLLQKGRDMSTKRVKVPSVKKRKKKK